MADEEKTSTPKKRPARKKPSATSETVSEPVAAEAAELSTEEAAGDREVMTTSSTGVAVAHEDSHSEASPASEPTWSIDDLNRLQFGELVVHASTRDIVIVLDGASAAKLMAVFSGTGHRRVLQDLMIAGESNMANLWSSIDLSRVIGISWIPRLPSRADSVMTVDPPVPDALIP